MSNQKEAPNSSILPDIPRRSLLISPAPIGLGSVAAESLFSYFCRVALQNSFSPGHLVFGPFTALATQERDGGLVFRRTARASLARRTVSVSEIGYQFATRLASLVGRPEVMRMHWRHTLSGYSFARMTRGFAAYCPKCLGSDLEPHEHIAWELALFGACVRHQCVLVSRCGRCGRRASRLSLKGKPWECPLCGHDRRLDHARSAGHAEIAAAEELGALVAEATAAKPAGYLAARDCVERLMGWADTHGARSVKQVAKYFAISVGTASLWRSKRIRPSASRLVELGLRNGLPLPALYRGDFSAVRPAPTTRGLALIWKRRRLTGAERSIITIRTEALATLNPMRPVPEVAAELNISPRTLRQIAPELCSQMKANYAANRRRIKERKMEWFCRKVESYVAACFLNRQPPTWQGFSLVFQKPGILRNEVRRRYAKRAIRRAQELLPGVPEQMLLDISV
ncbi:TniQ family protein [Opitutus terrae]|uniref:TniQ domain-containing protein n=1 Tax=Opitutus terrae (strain DSM 11246 / JCM 15787 / PB90-1) TaxID=452637 RepID=B1ZSH5_OPITP|nr:TniQ family protein [Opitutus terrae]ACB73832.1 hypothetical protein Oter_0542 [Opitutus terrae PB90-1]